MTTIEMNPEAIEAAALAKREADIAVEESLGVTIENQETYNGVADVLLDVKARAKDLKAKRDEVVKPLKDAVKTVDALFKEPLKQFETAEGMLKDSLASYITSSTVEQERLLTAAMETGGTEGTAMVQRAAALATPAVEGIQTRSVMKFEIENFEDIPREFLKVDDAKVRAAVRVGDHVPGVRAWQDVSIAVVGKK